MKRLDPKIYSKEYYLNSCLGFEEFKKHKGKKVHARIEAFSRLLNIKKGMRVLDLGCGRGDLAIECARKGAIVVGADYSKDGIALAQESLKHQSENIRKNVQFLVMDAKKLKFTADSFDVVTSFDVFEHLYKEELEKTMNEISRVLKTKGTLVVHTATNRVYLDYTHHLWVYPINLMLIYLNKIITNHDFPGLEKDPRNDLHKQQHVNEPTYFYLKKLFKRHAFRGTINSIIPYKPLLSWKDRLYNYSVWLYPLSKFLPLSILFACDFICIMKNNKS